MTVTNSLYFVIMKNSSRVSFLFLSLFGVASTLFGQGPLDGYLKGEGHIDFALSGSVETADFYYFGNERQELQNRFESINFFAEWGFSDSLDLIFTLPYIRTPKCDTCSDFNQGFQDAALFAKFKLLKKEGKRSRFKLLGALGGSIPISNYQVGIERPIGIGATTLHAKLIAQYEWYNGPFVHVQTGGEIRISPNFLTSIPVLVRVGYATSFIFVEAWLEIFETIEPGIDNSVLAGNGSSWSKLGASIYVPLHQTFGLTLGTAHIINGSNIGLSSRYSVGAVYRFLGRK
jgi:hypothetical protein